jgi:pyruvate,water dikinase
VTYSDINNTAMLIEIARKKGDYTPDLSFGTHFFQDLVEASIRYLPLYPDEDGVAFNETFLTKSPNVLRDVAPEYADLDDLRASDRRATGGGRPDVLQRVDERGRERGGRYAGGDDGAGRSVERRRADPIPARTGLALALRMAEHVAARLDPDRFGVVGFYVFGSVKNATAGPASDIDVLIHFCGTG